MISDTGDSSSSSIPLTTENTGLEYIPIRVHPPPEDMAEDNSNTFNVPARSQESDFAAQISDGDGENNNANGTFSWPIPLSQRSRIIERFRLAEADGVTLGDDSGNNNDHDHDDDDDDDFVAVDHEDAGDFGWYLRRPPPSKPSKLNDLHPFVQLLSLANVEDCLSVEAAFPEAERCSAEKVCMDLFISIQNDLFKNLSDSPVGQI